MADIAHAVARAPDLEIRLDRDHHEVVLRLPEDRPLRLRDADHFERNAFDDDRSARSHARREKLVLQIVPDERHVHVPVVLDLRNEASVLRFEIGNHADVRRRALHAHAFGDLLALMDRHAAAGDHADLFGHGGRAREKLVLLASQLRIAAQHLHVLLRVEAQHHHALHAIAVRAHIGDVLAM